MHFRQPLKFSAMPVGFFLLGVCLLLGCWIGGAAATVGATQVNMWVGLSKAGYSIKDEAPVALLVFAVPANRCHCHLVEILCFLS